MRYVRFDNQQASGSPNPFVQILGLIFGAILFVAAVLLGGIVIAAVIGFFLIAGVIIYVRVWWLMRKAGLSHREGRRDDSFVEAEYRVVDPTSPDDKRR
jgi:Flp pilus assembly protein TadB